ncbi:MAG: MOSC domain-containing protein [Gammaproteobacteria bacterium]|nr:MOSC domain-containing protein [Gammaproteobacteria bacterium]
MVQITDLFIYPVKSLKGISLNTSETSLRGLKFDREWMITNSDYEFITQREIESMSTIEVSIDSGALTLSSKNNTNHTIPLDSIKSELIKASVWGDICDAYDEGGDVALWLTSVLGQYKGKSLRLVRYAKQGVRPVPSKYLEGMEAQSAFSDQFPYLVTSWESLDKLNKGLIKNGSQVAKMNRFRPNIVVKGIEDLEKKTSLNFLCQQSGYSFGLRKPCKRCKIITINQDDGKIDNPKEPLATLTSLRFSDAINGAFFGQNAILLSTRNYILKVGDELSIG